MTVSEHIRISIHSTARVETDYSMALLICSSQFQSTPPRGWRHQLFDGINHITQISIHSTARVETPLNKVWVYLHIISIHSTARVETVFRPHGISIITTFQSTPPRGWRLITAWDRVKSISYFNPLHREGGDISTSVPGSIFILFQSTPPRGWRL